MKPPGLTRLTRAHVLALIVFASFSIMALFYRLGSTPTTQKPQTKQCATTIARAMKLPSNREKRGIATLARTADGKERLISETERLPQNESKNEKVSQNSEGGYQDDIPVNSGDTHRFFKSKYSKYPQTAASHSLRVKKQEENPEHTYVSFYVAYVEYKQQQHVNRAEMAKSLWKNEHHEEPLRLKKQEQITKKASNRGELNFAPLQKKVVPCESEEQPIATHSLLKPWYQYKIENVKSDYLRFFIMQLAKPNAQVSEIPFRAALIETLLSPKYQSHINATWAEETEDIDVIALRRAFVFDYLRAVSWEKTNFTRLFLGDTEDLHQVNLDAFDEAMELPLQLGIFRNEDLSCDQ